MYGKLFAQMYDGTLGTKGPWQALVTFQQLVILADKHGEVDMTPEAIARRTTIPLEIITEGLNALEQPDPLSRSPELEGRRIVRLNEEREWGWRIVNYLHYRRIRTQDERKAYMREYQRKRRAAVKANVNLSTSETPVNPKQPISSKQYGSMAVSISTLGSRKNGARQSPDDSPVVQTLPLRDGTEFEVRQSFIAELEPLYPSVDIARTVGEMKGWLLGNKERRKTRRGVKAFITRWLHNEQQKAEVN